MSIWKPHTEKPTKPITAVIAHKYKENDYFLLPYLAVFRNGEWKHPDGESTLITTDFMWVDEDYLISLITEKQS